MSADDRTPLQKLKAEFARDLSGIGLSNANDLKEALYILNNVTDENLEESLSSFSGNKAKVKNDMRAPHDAMAELLYYIYEKARGASED
jgi:hypothetical protein